MAEYITKDKAKELVCDFCQWNGTPNCEECEHPVDDVPAADVQPVRHGRWVKVEVDKDDDGIPTLIMAGCDQCHSVSWTSSPFCGYCGAKMDGGET